MFTKVRKAGSDLHRCTKSCIDSFLSWVGFQVSVALFNCRPEDHLRWGWQCLKNLWDRVGLLVLLALLFLTTRDYQPWVSDLLETSLLLLVFFYLPQLWGVVAAVYGRRAIRYFLAKLAAPRR
ncbi:hypothetical protein GCM10009612_76770 [Streptomyces beijiangensis]